MDSIRAMRTFVRAVDLGSLSAVAREFDTTQPTVSKIIAGLEAEMGARLLTRTTTSLSCTEQGERFYLRARQMVEAYDEAKADVRGLIERPEGRLRVAAPVSLGVLHLNRLVLEFMQHYPEIEVDVTLNDRFIDLAVEGVDVAVRIGGDLPPDVVARPLATYERTLVASPAYVTAHAAIRRPEDLAKHAYLRFARLAQGDSVTLGHRDGRQTTVLTQARYRINNSLAIREALLAGAGVGLAPDWLVGDLLEHGRLQRILPTWRASPHALFLLYPPRRYQPLRARLFIDFVTARLGAHA
ncbi:LysR family transcriptional regulator [Trinickia dabaoshanensis]|uniref:LysR family transcriptional regulator n=2 Tax=Trinickia dabaoshanensis TaxID=564714 RepID=A0A2N7VE36_9BURK|nr:LysR family transcriptional regulator [Trinickia dabaoshanensis]PMS15374.1 LysR family transcriptional regulator [Trinickia dabaoshanensis]